jgi:hypothetical protein
VSGENSRPPAEFKSRGCRRFRFRTLAGRDPSGEAEIDVCGTSDPSEPLTRGMADDGGDIRNQSGACAVNIFKTNKSRNKAHKHERQRECLPDANLRLACIPARAPACGSVLKLASVRLRSVDISCKICCQRWHNVAQLYAEDAGLKEAGQAGYILCP